MIGVLINIIVYFYGGYLNLNKVNKLDSDYETVRLGPFHRAAIGKNRNKKNIK